MTTSARTKTKPAFQFSLQTFLLTAAILPAAAALAWLFPTTDVVVAQFALAATAGSVWLVITACWGSRR